MKKQALLRIGDFILTAIFFVVAIYLNSITWYVLAFLSLILAIVNPAAHLVNYFRGRFLHGHSSR